MKIAYLPIESYKERYTELLEGWTIRQLEQQFGPGSVTTFRGYASGNEIKHGRVLDKLCRSEFALTQMAEFVRAIDGGMTYDAVYVDDMFTPGYEALAYMPAEIPIFARNHAQSMDVYDFTFEEMLPWMRYYELMVASTARTIFCASSEHKQLMQVAWLGHHCPIEVVGLPFDMQDVRRRVADWKPREDRENRVVYSSRWDREKQPHFFLNVVNRMQGTEFIVCTGSEELRGEPTAVQRAHEFEAAGKLTILRDCTKEQYFSTLASARVHFLCSLQDWVSYSLLDASACGTPTVAPCFRSFPEAVGSDPARLYTPWNASEAVSKISALLNTDDMPSEKVEAPARYHTETIERIAQVVRERSS